MDVQNVKLDLLVWLANLQDQNILKQLLEFRKQAEKSNEKTAFKPMTQEELIARALESEKAFEAGEVIDIDDLAKEN